MHLVCVFTRSRLLRKEYLHSPPAHCAHVLSRRPQLFPAAFCPRRQGEVVIRGTHYPMRAATHALARVSFFFFFLQVTPAAKRAVSYLSLERTYIFCQRKDVVCEA